MALEVEQDLKARIHDLSGVRPKINQRRLPSRVGFSRETSLIARRIFGCEASPESGWSDGRNERRLMTVMSLQCVPKFDSHRMLLCERDWHVGDQPANATRV